jgi:hypothetical protein
MQFQLASDLHLEFYKDPRYYPLIIPSAPYLFLAGDIGYPFEPHYQQFLSEQSTRFLLVFVIAGNHEYYQNKGGKTKEQIDTHINIVCNSFSNVIYLNNRAYELEIPRPRKEGSTDKVVILGTTLWTNVPSQDESVVMKYMNDYRKIYTGESGQRISVSDTNKYHEQSVKWLESELTRYENECVIVMSHHLPSSVFVDPKYRNDPLTSAFMTDLEYLLKKPIRAWVAGHTHTFLHKELCFTNDDQSVSSLGLASVSRLGPGLAEQPERRPEKIVCAVNPAGYRGENTGYIPDFVISLATHS